MTSLLKKILTIRKFRTVAETGNMNTDIIKQSDIENRIYTIRGIQVMLDSDLAEMYDVETKVFNQAVKRNIERFPDSFRFQLTQEEFDLLRSQIVTLEKQQSATGHNQPNILRSQNATLESEDNRGKHRKYLPYAFTEQGVSMLSAVLRSATAVKVSIAIMNAFVDMRKFITSNATLFQRLDKVEKKQLEADENFEKLFSAIEAKSLKPKYGIFFNGEVYDAHTYVSDIFRSAKKSIFIIDNYIDDSVLTLLLKRNKGVTANIYTKTIDKQLKLDLKKHNEQYDKVAIKQFNNSHDRFIIIDNSELYHFGASLKDLGKKWFAFSRMDTMVDDVLKKLNEHGK